ncbi:MAG: hypothetical protein ACT4PT_00475 [Methanobacteriota archaeon]
MSAWFPATFEQTLSLLEIMVKVLALFVGGRVADTGIRAWRAQRQAQAQSQIQGQNQTARNEVHLNFQKGDAARVKPKRLFKDVSVKEEEGDAVVPESLRDERP